VDHRRIDFRVAAPRLVLVELPRRIVVRNAPQAVRGRPAQVSEERPILVFANELFGFGEDLVLAECLSCMWIAVVAGERNFLAVTYQVLGEEGVGVRLVVVAEECIEAVLFRDARGAASTVAPFAEAAAGIA